MIDLLKPIKQSLFFRLLLIFLLTVFLLFTVLTTGVREIYEDKFSHLEGQNLFGEQLNFMIDNMGYPPDLSKAALHTEQLPIEMVILDGAGAKLFASDDIELHRLRVRRQLSETVQSVRSREYRGVRVERNGYVYLVFGQRYMLDKDDRVIVNFTLLGLLLVLLLNYLLVRYLLRPIKWIEEGAQRISEGELDYRVQSSRNDELGALSGSINHMADSLNSMLEAKQQLLLAISHELRSPITRLKVQLELIEDQKLRQSLEEDTNELDRLVSELLEAERLNSQHARVSSEAVAIVPFTQELIQNYWRGQPLLEWHPPENSQLVLQLDKLRYTLLLRNLVSNALKYGEGKPVSVSIALEESFIVLRVRDQGEGIEAHHLQHITEPFYRTDNARLRQTGGFGLGLYLCRLIAEVHGGDLHIDSVLGQGTCVAVRLPISN